MPPPVGRRISGRNCVARLDLGKFLEIAKRRRRFRPAVKSQNRLAELRNIFKQRLVQRHVERGVAFAGIEQKPRIHLTTEYTENTENFGNRFYLCVLCAFVVNLSFTPIRGHNFSISQFAQSGLRAKQRRRPCQMSQWLNSVQSFLRHELHQLLFDFFRRPFP